MCRTTRTGCRSCMTNPSTASAPTARRLMGCFPTSLGTCKCCAVRPTNRTRGRIRAYASSPTRSMSRPATRAVPARRETRISTTASIRSSSVTPPTCVRRGTAAARRRSRSPVATSVGGPPTTARAPRSQPRAVSVRGGWRSSARTSFRDPRSALAAAPRRYSHDRRAKPASRSCLRSSAAGLRSSRTPPVPPSVRTRMRRPCGCGR